VDHPKNIESRPLFACAGASRPTTKRPVVRKFLSISAENFEYLDKQHAADYGQTVTDHYFSGGGLWTAGHLALP
jgi:hypothetical protein